MKPKEVKKEKVVEKHDKKGRKSMIKIILKKKCTVKTKGKKDQLWQQKKKEKEKAVV